jgi:hypothetical protein
VTLVGAGIAVKYELRRRGYPPPMYYDDDDLYPLPDSKTVAIIGFGFRSRPRPRT